MPTRDGYAAGTPSWVDLMTPDLAKARGFYTELFGWDTREAQAEGQSYTMFLKGGQQVAGVGEQSEAMRAMGVPSVWTTYLATDDADETAQRVRDAGGAVQMEPVDIADSGRIGIFADPTGAVFGAWQANQHRGAQLVNEPGAVIWNELNTTDTAAARDFYTQVFGFGTEEMPIGEGEPYTMWQVDGETVGGMNPPQDAMPAPPHWLTYFAVDDCDAAVARAAGLGGETVLAPMDTAYGRMAVLRDPTGATFAVMSSPSQEAAASA